MEVISTISDTDKICLLEHNTEAYREAVALRYEVLRRPLGLQFDPAQLAAELSNYHFAYYRGKALVAYLMLVPQPDRRIKMKQVVTAIEWQGSGIGSSLVKAAERYAAEKGFTEIYCHARDTALSFYERLGYRKKGEMFTEVSIPHYYMEKRLTAPEAIRDSL